jgi:1-pyrroline-4-hydroxy-2-carboxylate deaminase
MALFEGIIPAVTTPFDADDEVDVAGLQSNVEAMIDAGVHGFVATGTMGEAGSLTAAERDVVVRAVIEAAAGRVPVTVGISSSSAAQSIAYAEAAADAGAAAVMCLPVLGYRADLDELIAFFREVAGASSLPVMAYNNPEAAGVDLPAATIVRLFEEIESIVAIKECSGDARRIPELIRLAPELEVVVGGDNWAFEGLATGGIGWITGVGVVAPRETVELYDLIQANDLAGARALYARLRPLADFDMTPKLVQYYKEAQDAVGLKGGPPRPPRLPLNAAEKQLLQDALATLRAPAHA